MQDVWRAMAVAPGGDGVPEERGWFPGPLPLVPATGVSLAVAIPLAAVLSMGAGRLADGAREPGPGR